MTTSCLITDVHMPGLSGVELYQRLRADGFMVPTIVVTGHPDETTRTRKRWPRVLSLF